MIWESEVCSVLFNSGGTAARMWIVLLRCRKKWIMTSLNLISVFLHPSLSWLILQSLFQRWRGVSMPPGTCTNTVIAIRYMHRQWWCHCGSIYCQECSVDTQHTCLLSHTHSCIDTLCNLSDMSVCLCVELQKVPAAQRVPEPALLLEQDPSCTWWWDHVYRVFKTQTFTLEHTHTPRADTLTVYKEAVLSLGLLSFVG